MNTGSERLFSLLRIGVILTVSCVTMAVSCPHPDGPKPVDPIDSLLTKSAERNSFESAYVEGMYIGGSLVLAYDEDSFQKSVNQARKTYRIQSDDQKRFMNIVYSGELPDAEGDECACTLNYSLEDGNRTMLIVKFVVVKASGDYLWLWNEIQKTGVIVPVI